MLLSKPPSCFSTRVSELIGTRRPVILRPVAASIKLSSISIPAIHKGIRGRVAMGNVGGDILSTDEDSGLPLYTPEEQCWKLDSLLADEYFFELSGEGQVMFALYRMMQNYPEKKEYFIKSMAAGRGDVESILSADKGWFIDYDLTEGN